MVKERDIERALVRRVKELGGEVRKVQWIGRSSAPDRLVMIPGQYVDDCCEWPPLTVWIELKNPETLKTFPANPHERAQHREHQRLRAVGQRVEVIGTVEQIEELLK